MNLRVLAVQVALGLSLCLAASSGHALGSETTPKHGLTHASMQHRTGKPRAQGKGMKTRKLHDARPKVRARPQAPRRPR